MRIPLPIFVLFFILIGGNLFSYGQKESDYWVFGHQSGIHFSDTGLISLTSAQYSDIGSAVISDSAGQLLFYTDGHKVYNRFHTVLKNGNTIKGDNASQSSIIVPYPGFPSRYFLFTIKKKMLYYYQIDMDGDNGAGELILSDSLPSLKMISKITALKHCNQIDYWLVVQSDDFPGFYSFQINYEGVNRVPVNSNLEMYVDSISFGILSASPLGNRLALTYKASNYVLSVFNYDALIGKVSNPRSFSFKENSFGFGAGFSPDGTNLYFTVGGEKYHIYQMSMLASTTEEMKQSITHIAGGNHYAVQAGADGKMYFAKVNQTYLSAIEKPSVQGIGCGYQENALTLTSGKCMYGLPNIVQTFVRKTSFRTHGHCLGDTTWFTVNFPEIYDSVLWHITGTTLDYYSTENVVKLQLPQTGVYSVNLKLFHCGTFENLSGSIELHEYPSEFFTEDSLLMTSIPFLIDASGDNFVYYWNDGSANPVYAAYDPGLLNVEICNAGCCIPDSVILFKQEVDIWIPSAFSPNADGVNDVFVPKVAPGITGQMYIYNRQGQLLHKCTQLDEGWDGRNKGKQCKNDVYIWMIEHDKTQCRKYGTVMLLN